MHADHLDTPRVITDANQSIVWRWDNDDAFGGNVANQNPSGLGTFAFNLRFPGQYFDGETGNHYNYFRDYSPETGRYVESDPIGLEGGLNTYGYVDGNPLLFIDPDGREWLYSQNTGNLYRVFSNGGVQLVATGYSGRGKGLNNSSLQGKPNEGPIPKGGYTIGPLQQNYVTTPNNTVLALAMRLTPNKNTNLGVRFGFLIHSGSFTSYRSSNGCIIMRNNILTLIGASGDPNLLVIP